MLTPALEGHHAFAAEYDGNRPVTLTGTLLRVDFVNPHAWLYVAVKATNGREETWNIEMGSPNSLIRRGFTRDAVAVGTEVVIDRSVTYGLDRSSRSPAESSSSGVRRRNPRGAPVA